MFKNERLIPHTITYYKMKLQIRNSKGFEQYMRPIKRVLAHYARRRSPLPANKFILDTRMNNELLQNHELIVRVPRHQIFTLQTLCFTAL